MKAGTSKPILRQLLADEIEAAYEAYLQVCSWLRQREIRLWLRPLPKDKFQQRQKRGEQFGLFVDDRLAVIMAIIHETVPYWSEEIGSEARWWLSTIATTVNFKGQKLGERAIEEAMAWLGAQGAKEVYLDCAKGFLPAFYQQLGFTALAAKDVTFPSGNTYPLVLMKKVETVNRR